MREPIPFGKYLLLDRIAVGGMAEVFAAIPREGAPARLLAVKRILPTLAEDGEFLTMFLDEARIAVQLHHPGIVPILELGKQGPSYYIAMEYVAGTTLRALVDRMREAGERMPVPLAAHVAWRVADALDYAHRKRDARGAPLHVVHRDVSPANVLLGFDGSVQLIDFGIAQAAIRARHEQEVLRGKFGYMSPEQVRGLAVDRRADVFALGTVLHEMLAGERLFSGASELAILEKVRNAEVRPPSASNPAVPSALDAVALRALAREADARFPWASELRDALRPFARPGAGVDPPALARLLAARFPAELRAELDRAERARGRHPAPARRPEEEPTQVFVVRFDASPADTPVPDQAPAPGEPDAAGPAAMARPASRRGPALAATMIVAVALALSLVLAAAKEPPQAPARPTVAPAAPGRLAIQPAEAARVLLDEAPLEPALAAGEVRIVEVPPGLHRVEIETADGHRGRAIVEVQSGETAELLQVELR